MFEDVDVTVAKAKAIIVDLDGTLANIEHRRHFVTDGNKDWKSFNKSIPMDVPNQWCLDLVDKFSTDHFILLVTGREGDPEIREATIEWVQQNDIPYEELFMRGWKDYRSDSIIKREIYKTKIEPWYDVQFCVDDRQQVVDMWREEGLICLQCDKGDF